MPIRWRLTLWFSVIVLLILVISGTLLYFQLRGDLLNDADKTLNAYTSRVHGSLMPTSIDQSVDYNIVHSQLPPINEFSSPGIYLEIVDSSGTVVVKSDNLISQVLPPAGQITALALQGNPAIGTVSAADGTRVRILATPLYLQDQTLVLEVAQSLQLVDSTMNRLKLALLGSVLLAVMLVAVTGAVTLSRAFRPVRLIAQTAHDIEQSADLSRRVGHTGTSDEVGQLAATFDHMINHLETVFKSQKKFIADASHELRSPLTVIRGNLDLVRKHPDKEDITHSLGVIQSETTRMSRIVDDLLLLAEIESEHDLRRGLVSLNKIAAEEVQRARSLSPSRTIAIARNEEISIAADDGRIHQLFSNLLENATKHTPASASIAVSLYRQGEWACLDVSDTGPGIAPEHLPHLFDRFYRADKARSRSMGSHGLGLAIVKGIAEQLGGSVDVESEPGKGTTFKVRLRIL